jgi:hypothetical protein
MLASTDAISVNLVADGAHEDKLSIRQQMSNLVTSASQLSNKKKEGFNSLFLISFPFLARIAPVMSCIV